MNYKAYRTTIEIQRSGSAEQEWWKYLNGIDSRYPKGSVMWYSGHQNLPL